MKAGQLLFHQGWADIFNCLPLLNYYLQDYDELYFYIRKEAVPLLEFYTRQFGDRVIALVGNKDDTSISIISDVDRLFHGDYDSNREDMFQGAFGQSDEFFPKRFYSSYDIPYTTRITHFEFERDLPLEQKKYEEWIERYGAEYALQHSVPLDGSKLSVPVLELNQTSDVFFDSLMICEHAKEMHLLDSSWATFLYMVDTKYGLFQHIPIYVYCMRDYAEMFLDPIRLPNWHIMIRPDTMRTAET